MTKVDSFITAKIRDFFEYTIAGEWGSEGNPEIDIPVLRSTNFTNKGKIDYSDLAYRKIDSSFLSRKLVNKETILIEKSGGSPSQPAGRVVYCEEDFIGSASNFIEIAKTKNLYCAKYIFFLLHYLYQTGLVLKYQQQTTGIINFKLEQYKDEEVLFASDKKEQEKIAEILSTIDRAIAQTEAIIAKQQRIKTGLMQDLLTKGIDENGNIRSEATHEFKDSAIGRIPVEWDCVVLNQVCEKITDGVHYSVRKVEAGIPFLLVSCIRDGEILFDKSVYIDCLTYELISKGCEPFIGAILYTVVGSYGNAARVNLSIKFGFERNIAFIVPNNNVLISTYLVCWLNSGAGKNTADTYALGNAQKLISLSQLCNFMIPLPSIEEQTRIIELEKKSRAMVPRNE